MPNYWLKVAGDREHAIDSDWRASYERWRQEQGPVSAFPRRPRVRTNDFLNPVRSGLAWDLRRGQDLCRRIRHQRCTAGGAPPLALGGGGREPRGGPSSRGLSRPERDRRQHTFCSSAEPHPSDDRAGRKGGLADRQGSRITSSLVGAPRQPVRGRPSQACWRTVSRTYGRHPPRYELVRSSSCRRS